MKFARGLLINLRVCVFMDQQVGYGEQKYRDGNLTFNTTQFVNERNQGFQFQFSI